jgi:hypothetical protein
VFAGATANCGKARTEKCGLLGLTAAPSIF